MTQKTQRRPALRISDRLPNPAAAVPPLPELVATELPEVGVAVTGPAIPTFPPLRALRGGCYLLRYTPSPQPWPGTTYDGTLRVEVPAGSFNRIASGDLYLRQAAIWSPNPGGKLPIFARSQYRYYLRVTNLPVAVFGNKINIGFEMYRFTSTTTPLSSSWTNQGVFTAEMTWTTSPGGYPSPSDYLSGNVKNSTGQIVGTLTMGWISAHLRRAVFEVDRVPGSELPLDNNASIDWQTIMDGVGWHVTLVASDMDVPAPSGESWSDAEMHAAMLNYRDSADLDGEWRYHLLCVHQLDSTERGIMYDAYGGDTNKIPREGAGISSHWVIPNAAPWGKVKGQRFGATVCYFRTAVHEIGHALGLYHNSADVGIMNVTPSIAAADPVNFPDNIQWTFNAADAKRLRHAPDIWVRPGGISFGASYSAAPAVPPDDLIQEVPELELTVTPLLTSVPLGAPVRINIQLANTSDRPVAAPASLSMKAGFVRGKVADPSGTVRTFSPVALYLDQQRLATLEPGKSLKNSITLLRGAQGALFPAPGLYRIVVEIDWESDGIPYGVTGDTSVMATAAQTTSHTEAARQILSTPDTLLSLAIGGDYLEEGVAAIQAGMQDEALRAHFAVVEAKRLARRSGTRKPDLKAAADLLDDTTVMSEAEINSVAHILRAAGDQAPVRDAARKLKAKARQVGAGQDVRGLLDELETARTRAAGA